MTDETHPDTNPQRNVKLDPSTQSLPDTDHTTPDNLDTEHEMSTIMPRASAAPVNDGDQPTPETVFPKGGFVSGYEILGELGRGGMGVVYKARDQKLNRVVALKMILSGSHASDEDMRRFQTEAEAVARMQHPNIVQIYEVAEHEGTPFLALEFAEGGSLEQQISGTPQNARQSAELTETLARAIQAAHEEEIIHRDLKPANILLTAEGDPKITDFGLAKRMDDDSNQTKTGSLLGTPSYMAPEQVSGNRQDLGPSADIYALGAILYHLLTGRPPFLAETPLDTLMQVMGEEPVPPRRLNSTLPRDLETITLKCLEKDPQRRYESCRQMADDLRKFLDNEPISISSAGLINKVTRSLQRSKHDMDLRGWGSMLYWLAAIVFLTEFAIYFHAREGPPYMLERALMIRGAQFLAFGLVLYFYRGSWSVSVGSVERQMFSIWIAFFLSCWLAYLVFTMMSTPGNELDQRMLYPYFSILSGLIYFVMGSNYWGQCYTLGISFFILALLMPLNLALVPLEFGGLWALCLAIIGRRLRFLQASD